MNAIQADLKQKYDELSGKYQNLNIDGNLVDAYQNFDSLTDKTKNSLDSVFPHRRIPVITLIICLSLNASNFKVLFYINLNLRATISL